MSSKYMEEVPKDYFYGCGDLERIGMTNSNLHQVPNLNDTHSSLKYLHLSNNSITDIRHLHDVMFPELIYLDLSLHKIMAVEAHLIILPVISYVSLLNNRLVVLSDLTLSGWGKNLSEKKTVGIDIGKGNPWHCSAEMLWVTDITCTASCTNKQPHRIEIPDLDKMIVIHQAIWLGKLSPK